MKAIIILFYLLFPGSRSDLSTIRSMYRQSATNENVNEDLIALLNEKSSTFYRGYKGAAIMMKSKFSKNPFKKLELFRDGQEMLEENIKVDTTDVELRYLRLTIQSNVPGFLNYNSMIEQDKRYLSASLSKIQDTELKKMVSDFLNSEK